MNNPEYLAWAGFILGGSALLYQGLALFALFAWARRRLPTPSAMPPVSILKPLCGLEPLLYENLRSFCEQNYPCFEIIFGVQSADDPAWAIAQRLQSEFQRLGIRIVVQQENACVNRKIGNLASMEQHASHEYLVLSDSSTAVGPDYLLRLAGGFEEEGIGAITCLYRARPENSFWSRMAALYMNASFTPSIMTGWMLGMRDFGFGATLALRKSVLDAIGGFAVLGDHLADDYMLARLLRRRGLKTVLSPYMVDTVVHEPSLSSLWRHEMRWVRAVRILQPVGHAFSIVTHALPLTLIAFLLARTAPFAWSMPCAALLLRAATPVCITGLRDLPLQANTLLLPLRDAISFAVWLGSYFGRHVHWRGRAFRLCRNGHLQEVEHIARP